MKLATNKEVMDALGIDEPEAMEAIIVLEGGSFPRVIITKPIKKIENAQHKDWLAIINSGLSHRQVMAIVRKYS